MKKLLMFAALFATAVQAPAVQAQSRFDRAKERAKAKAKAAPDWFETRQEQAAREARERSALEAELKKNYGLYLDRAANIAKTYYAIDGDILFIYQVRSLIQIKDSSVRAAQFSINFTKRQDYSAANIANNGIVHSVRLDYYIDLKKPSINFLRRKFIGSERVTGERWIAGQWGKWSGVQFWDDHRPTLFSVNLYRRADGNIEIRIPQEFKDEQRWDISEVEKYIKNGDPAVHIAPLNCEWYDDGLDPYTCISWHRRSEASAGNSNTETVYGLIDRINKEDERRLQARMLREAAMPLKGYLGVSTQAVSPGMARAYKMKAAEGEWIEELQVEGPAEKAGLTLLDVIYMVNDQKIDPSAGVRLTDVISNMAAGSLVKLGVFRPDIGPLSYEVVLGGRR